MSLPRRSQVPAAVLVLLALALLGPGVSSRLAAQDDPPYDARYDEPAASALRVAWLAGEVGYNRGDDPDRWDPASLNFPMVTGDRLYTGRDGRAELELGGAHLFVAPQSDVAALSLVPGSTQLSLTGGSAVFRIHFLGGEDRFEVGTPAASVSFEGPGQYRVDVDRDGNSTVTVLRGRAIVTSGDRSENVRPAESVRAAAGEAGAMDFFDAPPPDSFDRWVEERARRFRRTQPPAYAAYVDDGMEGLADLDEAGRWQEIPEYGWAWTPAAVAVDWAPYRSGRWVWQDPWGWTWVGAEPWGWAPYHYGRWASVSGRWWWVPGPRSMHPGRPAWSPALVAFVGGGPGWSGSVTATGGYVGWFPLAPRDPFYRWWRPGGRTPAPPPVRVAYANRSWATVVRHDTFVSGTIVPGRHERDPKIVGPMVRGDVIRGPLPVLPVAASIRPSGPSAGPAPRPPAAWSARPVVTSQPPPPRGPAFSKKVEQIRASGGAPVPVPAPPRPSSPSLQPSQPSQPQPAQPRPGEFRPFRPDEGRSPRPEEIRPSRPQDPSRPVQPAQPPPTPRGFVRIAPTPAPSSVVAPPPTPPPSAGGRPDRSNRPDSPNAPGNPESPDRFRRPERTVLPPQAAPAPPPAQPPARSAEPPPLIRPEPKRIETRSPDVVRPEPRKPEERKPEVRKPEEKKPEPKKDDKKDEKKERPRPERTPN